ncbi:ComF family protein [Mycolicibacterium bacteremicum]|uniref:Phosphoribosyltransferase n=1 Tax=Mycolicibacterium bacteremicum TaxID=564198 RepID=A0A1W9YZQ6_MYCBA|nr:ComF family protein [Mycolicibacterium bacteremicum]MCV7435200.1 ComF family protein [Mycolicibacterium bacteremicum]ORA05543.1 phosphoribosyltransferase [Mycolicibacterium bacteremicum]
MLDLMLPLECGGCGAPATRWCATCAAELRARAAQPHVATPRLDPGVPVLVLGRYAGARRNAIVAVKERGRADLVGPLGQTLRVGLDRLLGWGLLDVPLTVVPAPTRRLAARRRGGDPVTRVARAATADLPGVTVTGALRLTGFPRDSVGLSSADRQRNLAGRVRVTRPVHGPVIVIDDVVTTGATACESVRALQTAGAAVQAVVALAAA